MPNPERAYNELPQSQPEKKSPDKKGEVKFLTMKDMLQHYFDISPRNLQDKGNLIADLGFPKYTRLKDIKDQTAINDVEDKLKTFLENEDTGSIEHRDELRKNVISAMEEALKNTDTTS